MKFDFHNLPFLAGGFDIGIGRTGEKLVEGFCPGLYFIKKPIKNHIGKKWVKHQLLLKGKK